MRHYKFTVSGRGTFPFDMLRYDCCYPHSPQDVTKLDGRGLREVTLIAAKPVGPTNRRWNSFGWDVVSEEVLR